MARYCLAGDLTFKVLRCKNCENCIRYYISLYRSQLLVRSQHLDISVVLWTLGTNWFIDRLDDLKKVWNKFNMNAHNRNKKYKMYMRVYEVGGKGKRLHVHFIAPRYSLNQRWVRTYWAKLVDIKKPNVNYVEFRYCNVKGCFTYGNEKFKKSVTHVVWRIGAKGRYLSKDICSGRFYGKYLEAKFAFMYLSKYMTKAQMGEGEYRIKRAHYIGKELWYKWKLIKSNLVRCLVPIKAYSFIHKQFVIVNAKGKELWTNGNNRYREFFYGTFVSVREWNDIHLECARKNCSKKVIIKFGQILDYSQRSSVLKEYFPRDYKVRLKELDNAMFNTGQEMSKVRTSSDSDIFKWFNLI